MKRPKFIFYLIFFAFHLSLLIFTLYVEGQSDNIMNLIPIADMIPAMKYFALAGMVLFLIDFILANLAIRSRRIEVERMKNEYNALKAKMYDLQEQQKDVKPVAEETEPIDEETSQDDESSATS